MAKSKIVHLHGFFRAGARHLKEVRLAIAVCGAKDLMPQVDVVSFPEDANCKVCLKYVGEKTSIEVSSPSKIDPSIFEAREGSKRKKLIDALVASLGKEVLITDLTKIIYGSSNPSFKGPLNNVLKGMSETIDKKKLNCELLKTKTTIGLFEKEK